MKKWDQIEGPLLDDDGPILQSMAKDKVVLEIGSWKGKSTACLAEVANHVYACDPHTSHNAQLLGKELVSLDDFKENTKGYDNITLLLGTSKEMVPSLENEFFDFVFIDGCHSYPAVKLDIELSLPKLKKGGVMAFHDWGWDGAKDGGVVKAVEEKFRDVELPGGAIAYITRDK